MMKRNARPATRLASTAVQAPKASAASAPVNQVLEWNQIFIDTLIATNTANSSSQRLGAIVHTAIFDATTASTGATDRFSLVVRRPAPRRDGRP
jgi:hypothetical protein